MCTLRISTAALFLAVSLATAAAPPEAPAPEAPAPDDQVRVEICTRGVPTGQEWPKTTLPASERYPAPAFAFFRTPHLYVETGIRADRPNPYLLRASASVSLPAGRHRLLLRARGASRLLIDGQPVLTTPFPPGITDGHTPIRTAYLDLGPDFRFAPPGNRENWIAFRSPGRRHHVVLETIVGGMKGKSALRPEPGETVVAWSPEGSTSFRLLAPRQVVAYTDVGWAAFAEAEEARLARIEADRRAACWQASASRVQARREQARRWLATTPEVPVPPLPSGFPAHNAIDHFIADRLARAATQIAAGKDAVDYGREVRPILEAKCFSCHQGSKVRGGLRLDNRAAALAGGDSGEPSIVPGQPAKSLLLGRIHSTDSHERMPPRGERLSSARVTLLTRWIEQGASYSAGGKRPGLTALTDDLTFLRRVSLDTVGVVPAPAEIEAFLADAPATRRQRVIDRLLADPRRADHWVGYWQDVLAENPNILNPTLNNTGPFRWWIHEALLDNKPLDVFAAELVGMRGSLHLGGPAGFAMASQNDVPHAEKGIIVAAAFLGVTMKCARCHDAPGHRSTQKDLFSLAALLAEKSIQVPTTSSVPKDRLHGQGREPLIKVTLAPGTAVAPAWPFADLVGEEAVALAADTAPRDRLAALLTAPANERFAQVLANRVWKRLMGRGIVEPVDDWEKGEPTHPELLRWLGRELVRSGYDLQHLVGLVLRSHAYQRQAHDALTGPDELYAAPARRRLSAEQVLDSLFAAAGKRLRTEEVSLDIDGGRDVQNSISLGRPRRAWQFASTSNERDRPSLSLPRVQAVIDVLEAFGWRSTRQDPVTDRESANNVLQPAILGNSPVSTWLTRLSDEHPVTQLALQRQTLETLVDRLFLRVLTRRPSQEERSALVAHLRPGYERRLSDGITAAPPRQPPRYVSWSNHLTEEANTIKKELEAAARRGDAPTARLTADWRVRLEDALWALLNTPEFVFTP